MLRSAPVPLLAAALLLSASEGRAQESWVALISEPGYTAWVDTASIQRTGDDRYSTWTIWSRSGQRLPGGGIGSVAEYREYDCGGRRSRLRGIFLLDTRGEAIDARDGSILPWEAAPRESDREILLDLVCILAIHRRGPDASTAPSPDPNRR